MKNEETPNVPDVEPLDTTTHKVHSSDALIATSRTKLRDMPLEQENFDLIAKVTYLIGIIGWSEDGTFTFPDGETWARFDPEGGSND